MVVYSSNSRKAEPTIGREMESENHEITRYYGDHRWQKGENCTCKLSAISYPTISS